MVAPAQARLRFAAVLSARSVCFFAAVVAAALRHIDFAPDDWLDVALAGFVEKIGRGKEVPVVRNGHGGHFLPRSFIEQLGRFACPVEQTEICMNVKMNKLRLTHGSRF